MSRRRALVSDADRIAAARHAAFGLLDAMRERSGQGVGELYPHVGSSDGGVLSEYPDREQAAAGGDHRAAPAWVAPAALPAVLSPLESDRLGPRTWR